MGSCIYLKQGFKKALQCTFHACLKKYIKVYSAGMFVTFWKRSLENIAGDVYAAMAITVGHLCYENRKRDSRGESLRGNFPAGVLWIHLLLHTWNVTMFTGYSLSPGVIPVSLNSFHHPGPLCWPDRLKYPDSYPLRITAGAAAHGNLWA